MWKHKKLFYKWIGFLAVAGIVMMIQGMALTGAFYFTDVYQLSMAADKNFSPSDGTQMAKTQFYYLKLAVLSGDESDSLLLTGQTTEYTRNVIWIMHSIYAVARVCLWIGVFICIVSFILLRKRKKYKVLKRGAVCSFALPPLMLFVSVLVHARGTWNVLSGLLFSRYENIFIDDEAIREILPSGVFLGYIAVYLLLWLITSAVFMIVYRTKKKHRSPYQF